jgi:FkbM family methyltransferase
MKQRIKDIIKGVLMQFDIGVTGYNHLKSLKEFENDLREVLNLPPHKLSKLAQLVGRSKSQFWQDLFVLSHLDFKKNGYFVEFGAADGIYLSNTFLLENDFGWSGILVEPGRCWHDEINKNRTARIERQCVWSKSQLQLMFSEAEKAELSTISALNQSDMHGLARQSHINYSVTTISLLDLLEKYKAPCKIDYLSIDTEGSEYEILRNFDFDRYSFNTITCEHNFGHNREAIYNLLTNKGYKRVYTGLSKTDDWYIL